MQEKSLHGIEKPGRYIGGEFNSYGKSFAEAGVRFALAFPDVYEVGLSHLGLQLLYHVLNRMDSVMADRVYAPWQDYERSLRDLGEPLCGVESGQPLHAFDFVGFSLQYELSYSNILTILDLGGIPLESADRTLEHPCVIGGGPCVYNPEPVAQFFDFFVLGEAEEVLGELVEAFERWKASRGTRQDFLQEIRKIEGVYVPSFFEVSYGTDGTVSAVTPRFDDYTSVRKRLILDLDEDAPIPETPLVPMLDIVHNRLGLEIARGCTRGCRFCQASFIYRPVRERDPQVLLERAQAAIAQSGFEELSLLSLSTGDYCRIQPLLAALMERFEREKVAVSFPSMRVGTLTPELMELIRRVRKTGFTLAPEAGSERLRRVINKGILEEDLLSAAESAFGLGWRVLKLYFMTGLPTEMEEDLDALVELSLKVWTLAKPSRSSVNVSVSTFVPKPQTPFQWAPQISREAVDARLRALKERLRKPGLRLKWHQAGHSILEGVFARGDRRLGDTLKRAWELGARFDGWTELFREDLWERAFEETGLDPAFYNQRERRREEILPWDHLSAGVDKEFLWKEYERALGEKVTPDCRWNVCSACGVCDHKTIQPRLHSEEVPLTVEQRGVAAPAEEESHAYSFRYAKVDKARFIGQLEVAQAFSRAVRRAGLPGAYSRGFHPHLKLSFADALPLGMESLVAEGRLTLTKRLDPLVIKSRLNACLPEGLRIEAVRQATARAMQADKQRAVYRISGLTSFEVHRLLDGWSRRLDDELVKKTKKGEKRALLREILLDMRQGDASNLEMDLFEGTQMFFRPTMILQHLLGEPLEHFAGCRICKTAVSRLAGAEEKEDVGRAHHQW